MAERFPTLRQRAQEYTGANDPTSDQNLEKYVVGPYNKYISNPYQEMKREKIQNAYNIVLEATGDQERALREANAVARKYTRGETVLETAALLAVPGGQFKAVERGAELARGAMRGRNAMTAEEMLAPTNRLVVNRPAPGGYSGSGYNAGPFEQVPFKPNYGSGAQIERMAPPPRPDVRSVPNELAVLEGEGGATADAVATARRIAQERLAAERGFRETQLATMEGEGGGAEALRAAQQRAREAEQAFLERQMMEAEGEGMGAWASRNRPPPRRYNADQDAAAGYGYTTQFPGTAVQPRYVGSQAATQPGRDMVVAGGRDVVPARTVQGDLEALMNRHFGGGETGGLPARGPTYFADVPNAGPRLVGESFAGESPAYAATVRTNPVGGGMPDWLKYALPTGAAVAGGTYLASGRGPSDGAGPASTPWPVSFDDLTQVPEMPREQPTAKLASDVLRQYGMNAFTQPRQTETPSWDKSMDSQRPQRPQREEKRGFLDRIVGQPTQSMGGQLIQDGRINWGSGESAADFFRAADAMRQMQREGKEVRGINPELEMDPRERKSGGKVDDDKGLQKALEIIHHLVKR